MRLGNIFLKFPVIFLRGENRKGWGKNKMARRNPLHSLHQSPLEMIREK
jgi:hypothetical protein